MVPEEQCVRVRSLHYRTCLLKHPRRLYAPWKGICFGSFPAFLGRGVMPLMPHRTVSDGVKRPNWVRPRHDGNVKRRGTESPILPMQLSRIWEVKFSPLQRCRAALSQDSTYCVKFLAKGEGTGRERWRIKINLNRQIWRDSCWVQTSYGGKEGRQGGRQKEGEGGER